MEGPAGAVFAGMRVDEVTGCSTSVVGGLSQQLIDGVNCVQPGVLVAFSHPAIDPGVAVWPYLQQPAAVSLVAAVEARAQVLGVNSAFRTLAQQYLLYRWYQLGQCSIALAARPGRSSHESGLAADIQDHAGWQPFLESRGWAWLGSADAVHFDYVGGGTLSLSTLSVLTFQRLWNVNNPQDLIDEDGLYGPQTEARLQQSPAEGFALPLCTAGTDAGVAMADAGTIADAARPSTDAAVPGLDGGADADAADGADGSDPTFADGGPAASAPPKPTPNRGIVDQLPRCGCRATSVDGWTAWTGLLAWALSRTQRRKAQWRHPHPAPRHKARR